MEQGFSQNRMEHTPIPQLVVKGSVPLMVSTLVSSMYGIVDSMFVARISEKALTATTVAFPITLFLFAIAIGTAMGVNSRLSRFLGEGEFKDARETGWTGIILAVVSTIPFVLIGLFSIGQFFASMGARLLQATGYASLSMAAQLTGSILNCVLDPMMIFGLFGFPAMGIEGAAIAFYGVFGKLQNFMFMPVNGLSQGIVPIVGYFYGAKNAEKIRETTKFALKIGTGVMLTGTIIFFLCPVFLMSIFDAGDAMLAIGRVGLRILAISFIPHGFILVLVCICNC